MGDLITINNEIRNIAYAYNLCVVLSKQIIDYDDQYYLQQVYNEILNNINLENFPKETALCDALISLLNTLSCIDIEFDQKAAIEEKYKKQKKNALWSAVPSPSLILTGGTPAGLVLNALLNVGTGFMNYKKTICSIEEEKNDNNLKLKKHHKEALNSHRVRLFQSAWQLSSDHPIPDSMRLSENDVDRYNDVMKDDDARRRYDRLEDMSDRFEAYPPYWFNLGETAREIYIASEEEQYKIKALNAFEQFEKIHFVFLRQDIFAAACALSHISLLDSDKDVDRIKELMNKAIKFSRDNYDLQQQCVPVALKIGDIDTARTILKRLTNENHSLEINGKLLSLIYNRYDNNKNDYDILIDRIGKENTVAWIDIKPQYQLDQFFSNMNDSHYALSFSGGEDFGNTN